MDGTEEEKCEHCGMPMSQCTCNKTGDVGTAPEGAAEGAVGGDMPPQQ